MCHVSEALFNAVEVMICSWEWWAGKDATDRQVILLWKHLQVKDEQPSSCLATVVLVSGRPHGAVAGRLNAPSCPKQPSSLSAQGSADICRIVLLQTSIQSSDLHCAATFAMWKLGNPALWCLGEWSLLTLSGFSSCSREQ